MSAADKEKIFDGNALKVYPPAEGADEKPRRARTPEAHAHAAKHPLVHVDDVTPERMAKTEGWSISEFRLPITGACGSSTAAFHSIFRPGSSHKKHLHARSDEIAIYLRGHGVVGQSNGRAEVRAGHCRLMPQRHRALLLQ